MPGRHGLQRIDLYERSDRDNHRPHDIGTIDCGDDRDNNFDNNILHRNRSDPGQTRRFFGELRGFGADKLWWHLCEPNNQR